MERNVTYQFAPGPYSIVVEPTARGDSPSAEQSTLRAIHILSARGKRVATLWLGNEREGPGGQEAQPGQSASGLGAEEQEMRETAVLFSKAPDMLRTLRDLATVAEAFAAALAGGEADNDGEGSDQEGIELLRGRLLALCGEAHHLVAETVSA